MTDKKFGLVFGVLLCHALVLVGALDCIPGSYCNSSIGYPSGSYIDSCSSLTWTSPCTLSGYCTKYTTRSQSVYSAISLATCQTCRLINNGGVLTCETTAQRCGRTCGSGIANPSGTFTSSCSSFYWSSSCTLQAICRDNSGRNVVTTLDVSTCGTCDVGVSNGKLQCSTAGAGSISSTPSPTSSSVTTTTTNDGQGSSGSSTSSSVTGGLLALPLIIGVIALALLMYKLHRDSSAKVVFGNEVAADLNLIPPAKQQRDVQARQQQQPVETETGRISEENAFSSAQ